MVGGATLTKLLGTSAWYAPGAAAAYVVESIIRDQKKVVPSCTYLEGEYGQNDICIGVPAVIGRGGVEKVLTLNLTAIGHAPKERIVSRGGAQQNDLICISGNLGAAYMGLRLLEREKRVLADVDESRTEVRGI